MSDLYIKSIKSGTKRIEDYFKELDKMSVTDAKSLLYTYNILLNKSWENINYDNDDYKNLLIDPPNDSVATAGMPEQGEEGIDKNRDKVTISTIHSAKGLEWPVVFVNSLVDGMTPHYRSLSDFEELEEERKLFYVACSRAKARLFLTAPDYFSSYSGYFDKVSRFVAEVPADTITVLTVKQPIDESDDRSINL